MIKATMRGKKGMKPRAGNSRKALNKRKTSSWSARGQKKKPASMGSGGDEPNQAWLTIRVESVDIGGDSSGSDMAFTASLWGDSVGFGVDTGQAHHRILYDGPYKAPPYTISVSAEERDPNSDDEFTEGTIDLAIDLGSLQGTASTTISQLPGDQDDNDTDDDDPNADPDPDEQASYTVTCSGEIIPAVEMSASDPIDWKSRTVTFDVLPPGVRGSVDVTLHASPSTDIALVSNEPVAGGTGLQKQFSFDAFPPDKTIEFETIIVEFTPGGGATASYDRRAAKKKPQRILDKRSAKGIGKGKVQITAYFLPDEGLFVGSPEQVALNKKGTAPYVSVHKDWIARVRGQEGRGLYSDKVYGITDLDKAVTLPDGTKVTQWMYESDEGGCATRGHRPYRV